MHLSETALESTVTGYYLVIGNLVATHDISR